MQRYNVGILLFDEVEVLDFAGPFEVFAVTADATGFDFFNVFTISHEQKSVRAKNGLEVIPDYSFLFHPEIHILVLPGGDGTKRIIHNLVYIDWVLKIHQQSMITASVCSGARILARAGLLKGLEATTHHQVFDDLESLSPSTKVLRSQRFVDTGKIITSGGISAGIDMSLFIVKKLFGERTSRQTQTYMEYGDWKQ